MTARSADRSLRASPILPLLLFVSACASSNPKDTTFDWNLQTDPGAYASREHAGISGHNPEDMQDREDRVQYEDQRAQRDEVTVASLPEPGHEAASASVPTNPGDTATSPGETPGFSWPLRGRILSEFGAGEDGQRNDGINIAAVYGTPIRAAAAGTVSYAGDQLKDYGNLVLIRHADGYITAYAHAESLTVSKGDVVKRGQVIGYAGDSGGVSEPQLHFEIRHNTTPLDPRPLLDEADSQG